jgi:hypothetical protein
MKENGANSKKENHIERCVIGILHSSMMRLIEVDWDSNIVWQSDAPHQTHDFTTMENGHIMYQA